MNASDQHFCDRIGYQFTNRELLKKALSHRSTKELSYERLEFLGDSILNCVIASYVFKYYPSSDEGELSRLRASLVKGATLAELGREFDIGDHLRLGPGELKSGGHRRDSILADAVEAVIGAIYMDSDFSTCESMILQWFASRLEILEPTEDLKDPKTLLQEYVQSKRQSLPEYETLAIEGEQHEQIFHVRCSVKEMAMSAEGRGRSRRRAEQEAAQQFLDQLSND